MVQGANDTFPLHMAHRPEDTVLPKRHSTVIEREVGDLVGLKRTGETPYGKILITHGKILITYW